MAEKPLVHTLCRVDVANLCYGELTVCSMDTGQFVLLSLVATEHPLTLLALERYLPIPLPPLAHFAFPHFSGTMSAQLTPKNLSFPPPQN